MEEKYKVEISEIKITPVHSDNGLVAIVSCVIDGKFFVGSIGIYCRGSEYRLTYPTKKYRSSSMSIFHPIKRVIADQIQQAVVEDYEQLIKADITSE